MTMPSAISAAMVHGVSSSSAPRTGTSSADLYHGPLSAFEKAGFEVVARPLERRAVVRLTL
jgi:hypothetical protein